MADDRAHLKRLRTQGFRPLRAGRIHLRCPECGRKQSNAVRGGDDPALGFLAEFCCDKCCQGHKDCGAVYFNKAGREIPSAWEQREVRRGR